MKEEIKKEKEVERWEELKLNVTVKTLTTDDNDELIKEKDLGGIDFRYFTKDEDIMDSLKEYKRSSKFITRNWINKQIAKSNKIYGNLYTFVKAGLILMNTETDWIEELNNVYVCCERYEKTKDYILLQLMYHVSDELIVQGAIKFYIREA